MMGKFRALVSSVLPVQRFAGSRRPAFAIQRRFGVSGAANTPISNFGMIGDRRTAAIVTSSGQICWYCPGRFDAPSLFNSMIDPYAGGYWAVELEGAEPAGRIYTGNSAILETRLRCPSGELSITDWMPMGDGKLYHGTICRSFSAAPLDYSMVIMPRLDNGGSSPALERAGEQKIVIDRRFHVHASHPISLHGSALRIAVPQGECSWAALIDNAVASPIVSEQKLIVSLDSTEMAWEVLAEQTSYEGPFAAAAQDSLRILRMLTYQPTGAIAASVTTSLPEILGGKRNFDYRYSWLRDSGMILRALCRFDPQCREARQYLSYVAALLDTGYRRPLDPVSAVGGERVPNQRRLHVAGYRGGYPNLSGNKAAHQLQLGSLANFVLSANEIYTFWGGRDHWDVVKATAEALAREWRDPGNGIWEEQETRHYTSGLVLTACALERISRHANLEESARWGAEAQRVRAFVDKHCRRTGVFVAASGSTAVDISVGLFPTWGFISADDPVMEATIAELDRQYGLGNGLYHRHLQSPKLVKKEGAFLAGTFWVAHYWIARGNMERGRMLIEKGLSYANDLGLFSEEVDPETKELLGNIPLGLIHGSFLSALADLNNLGSGKATSL